MCVAPGRWTPLSRG
jgi:putative transposase